ncbi:Uncharacterised protein [uncultured archaeon]|nr:Uncharacterised protein [uncultured archaeon]
MAAFRARRFVWSAMFVITPIISPIFWDFPSSSLITDAELSTVALISDILPETSLESLPTSWAVLLASVAFSAAFWAFVATCCTLSDISFIALLISVIFEDCWLTPVAISCVVVDIWSVEAFISSLEAESSCAVEDTFMEEFCTLPRTTFKFSVMAWTDANSCPISSLDVLFTLTVRSPSATLFEIRNKALNGFVM